MAQTSFSLMTNMGLAKEAAALASGTPIVITHISIGDGLTVPSGGETALYHEIARKTIIGSGTVVGASNAAYFDAFLAADEGPFTIREAGLHDNTGALIAIAHYDPPINKPIPSSGQVIESVVRLEIAFSNIANISIVVDPSLKVALQRLSRLPWIPVISMTATAPPAATIGDCYLIPTGATGAWAGQAGKIAEFTTGGWAMMIAAEGHGISLPDGRIFEKVSGVYIEKIALDAQSGKWTYAIATGVGNNYTVALTPAPLAMTAGLAIAAYFGTTNTGPATLNGYPIVNLFGSPLGGRELIGAVPMVFDGANWWAGVTQPALVTNGIYYVRPDGADGNNGLTNTPSGAFRTIQKAIDTISRINRNGFALDVQVANGAYPAFRTAPLLGPGSTSIRGNVANPAAVTVSAGAGDRGITVTHEGYYIEGFQPTGASGQPHFYVLGALCTIGAMSWGTSATNSHMSAGNGGTLIVDGLQSYVGSANNAHMFAADGGTIRAGPNAALVVPAVLAVGDFVVSTNGSINFTYASMTGAANIVSGRKFRASANGVINTQGAGENYFPGTTAGLITTGGQYV